jgi:cation diffusion facilitator family transporter
MHSETLEPWKHEHTFGQDAMRPGEGRTRLVIAITAAMMAVEIAAGLAFGSMALLADGLHMASHASALTISALAYYFTRKHARDERFNFGTGKINSLAGFASAVLLVGFAFIMAWESFGRILRPVSIGYRQAILVAVIGLLVNAACMLILKEHGHEHDEDGEHDHGPHDHNLWSAYLHVLADAATSVLAILALLAGRYFGWAWMDPLMGVVGAVLVAHWSWGLIRASGGVLLDMQAPAPLRQAMREAIENGGDNRVSDLHVWAVGPGIFAAEISVVCAEPREPEHYRSLLPARLNLVHVTVQAHRCRDHAATPAP